MKKNIFISLKLTLIMIILCAVLYPLSIAGIAKLAPGQGDGKTVEVNGRVLGYEAVGQNFSEDRYFWGRPSAVNYNAAGSAGSNKGPSNAEYLQTVQARIDSFLVHNPGIAKKDIPAELVTASGSGLDPDISPAAAFVQVKRIAAARRLSEERVTQLVNSHIQKPLLVGPEKINVLKLNIALDAMN